MEFKTDDLDGARLGSVWRIIEDVVKWSLDQRYVHHLIDTESVPNDVRYRALAAANGKCQLCGLSVKDAALHVVRIAPESKGGGNEIKNLMCLCVKCNLGKSESQLHDEPFRVDSKYIATARESLRLLRSELSLEHCEVIDMRLRGCPFVEIAEKTGIFQRTVARIVSKADSRLAELGASSLEAVKKAGDAMLESESQILSSSPILDMYSDLSESLLSRRRERTSSAPSVISLPDRTLVDESNRGIFKIATRMVGRWYASARSVVMNCFAYIHKTLFGT